MVRLGDVCGFLNGGTPSKTEERYYSGTIPLITGADIGTNEVTSARSFITQEAVNKSATNFVEKGTVLLVSRTGVGKVAIAGMDLCFSQDITAILPEESRLDKKYLCYFLKSRASYFRYWQRGATIQGITRDVIESVEIQLFPLSSQKRVVETLDKSQEIIDGHKRQLEELDNLIKATYYDMFGDPAKNEKGWELSCIRGLVKNAQYGTSEKAFTQPSEYPILRMNNITYSGEWDFSDLKYINLSENDKAKYMVHKGELLFNRTNSKEMVGKTAAYRENYPMAFAGYLIKLTPNERSNNEFLSAFLNSEYGKLVLRSMAKCIIGMANINAKELGSIRIYVPPIDLQNRFAEIVIQIENQKALVKQSIAESQNLFNSLMSRYFG
jgi:type I restriction enzyme S subunit